MNIICMLVHTCTHAHRKLIQSYFGHAGLKFQDSIPLFFEAINYCIENDYNTSTLHKHAVNEAISNQVSVDLETSENPKLKT